MPRLVGCPSCGNGLSPKAFECPQCGAPLRNRPGCVSGAASGCLKLILFAALGAAAVAVLGPALMQEKPQALSSLPPLPQHRFNPSSRMGVAKSQVRAVIKPGTMSEIEVRGYAVRLCEEYKSRAAGSFLVRFFGSDDVLARWDGTGSLNDGDWPSYICLVTVETDVNGNLYADKFELARDLETGEYKTDGLRP